MQAEALKSKVDAIANGDRFYLGSSCKNGHIGIRYTKGNSCVDCAKNNSKSWHESNKERVTQIKHEWHKVNAEYKNGKSRSYYASNSDRHKDSVYDWNERNKHKLTLYNANRRSAKLSRTPSWLTTDQLREIELEYDLARWCSSVMGTKYHVDHIVPLQGKTVSGLHVPWNLQVIPASVNCSKHNKLE